MGETPTPPMKGISPHGSELQNRYHKLDVFDNSGYDELKERLEWSSYKSEHRNFLAGALWDSGMGLSAQSTMGWWDRSVNIEHYGEVG